MYHQILEEQLKKLSEAQGSMPEIPQEFLASISTLYSQNDEDRVLLKQSIDISARELQKSISLLQASLDAIDEGILVVGRDGKIINFNARFAAMWRVPEEVMLTRENDRVSTFIADQVKNSDGFTSRIRELQEQTEKESYDSIEFKDGRVFERHTKAYRVGHDIIGRVWTFRDVSAQIYAQVNLIKERNFTEALFNSLPGFFCLFDVDGRMIRWNKNFDEVVQLNKDEIAKRTIVDYFEAPDKVIMSTWLHDSLHTGRASCQAQFIAGGGKKIWYLFTGTRFVVEEKDYLICVGTDISDRISSEEQHKKHMIDLEKLNRLMIDRELKMVELKREIARLAPQPVASTVSSSENS